MTFIGRDEIDRTDLDGGEERIASRPGQVCRHCGNGNAMLERMLSDLRGEVTKWIVATQEPLWRV
jgi:hypothetical protein